MTNARSNQARSAKRNARAKAKKISANKGRAAPRNIQSRSVRAALNGDRLQFDDVLGDLVADINKRKQVEGTITSMQDVLEGVKKTAKDVFHLFTYVSLVNAMIEKGLLEDHTLVVDLKLVARELINIDKRVQTMIKLAQSGDEDSVYTEALDISTELSNYTQELYAEVVRSEKYALTIESTLDSLAAEITDISELGERRNAVLSTLAYQLLDQVNKETIAETSPAASDAAA